MEKRIIFIFTITCIVFPFLMIDNPLEIASLVLPLWIYYPGVSGIWFHQNKSFLEIFLSCYAVGNVGIIFFYFGTGLIQSIVKKILRKIKSEKINIKNHHKEKIAKWTNKQNVFLILLVFLVPLPWSDSIATVAMELKKIRYGLYYLLILNILHVLIVIFIVRSGFNLLFF